MANGHLPKCLANELFLNPLANFVMAEAFCLLLFLTLRKVGQVYSLC